MTCAISRAACEVERGEDGYAYKIWNSFQRISTQYAAMANKCGQRGRVLCTCAQRNSSGLLFYFPEEECVCMHVLFVHVMLVYILYVHVMFVHDLRRRYHLIRPHNAERYPSRVLDGYLSSRFTRRTFEYILVVQSSTLVSTLPTIKHRHGAIVAAQRAS